MRPKTVFFILLVTNLAFGQDSLKVKLPHLNVPTNDLLSINVHVDDLTGLDVTSIQFTLLFSDSVLRAQGFSTTGTIMQNWGQPTVSISDTSSIIVGAFGLTPLEGEGNLINLLFKVVGEVGDSSLLIFKPFTFNNGQPVAVTDTGTVKIRSMANAFISSNYPNITTVMVDGEIVSTPYMVEWAKYSEHLIGANSPQLVADHERYSFAYWSDEGAENHYVAIENDSLFTAFYNPEFELVIDVIGVSPSNLIDLRSSWYKKDSLITFGPAPDTVSQGTAIGDTVFKFLYWEVDGVRQNENTFSVLMDSPHFATALYEVDYIVSIRQKGNTTPYIYSLYQNYPNPFNPETAITFQLPRPEKVEIIIFNQVGQIIRRLAEGEMQPGRHQVVWDARNDHGEAVASGVYLCQMIAGSYRETIKMILLQ